MANNELFKTIEQLKETLKDISSAREQVTETVDAYAQTRSKIQSYSETLKDIENVINRLVALLQDRKETLEQQSSASVQALQASCDDVLKATKEKLDDASQRFSSDTVSNIGAMSRQVDRLEQAIIEGHQLADKVEAFSAEVAAMASSVETLQQKVSFSQDALVRVTENISRKQDDAAGTLQTLSSTADDMTASLSSQNDILTMHGNNLQSLAAKCDSIASEVGCVKPSIENMQRKLTASQDALARVTENISRKQDDAAGTLQTLSSTADDMTASLSSQSDILTMHGNHLQSLAAKCDSIADGVGSVGQLCHGIQHSIQTSTASILSSADEIKLSQQNLLKEIKHNRYVSIALLIVVVLIAAIAFIVK